MIIYPAIDIRGGKCVRLTEGRFDQETVFADDPVAMAKRWRAEGAEFLHLVDLDGALAGRPVNREVIANIVRTVDIPVQLGGGIRTLATVRELLALGVSRVILGSVAVKQPELVKQACEQYPDQIVVGIDARDGEVAVEGWGVTGGIGVRDLAAKMAAAGVKRVVYTDITRDGRLTGVNATASAALARTSGLAVIASGGVAGLTDITAVKAVEPDGVEGVVIGKALYTETIKLPEALKIARGG